MSESDERQVDSHDSQIWRRTQWRKSLKSPSYARWPWILAEGWNKSDINPTWHGEIDAINQLVLSDPRIDGGNLVLYTTAEPCPMCQGAILWTGIEKVVFGTSIRSLQRLGWRQIDILAEEVTRRSPTWKCTIIGGVLEPECDALFALAMSRRG